MELQENPSNDGRYTDENLEGLSDELALKTDRS
jgi:hypothetical protein